MILRLYDHTDTQWIRRRRNTNGAETYSIDLVNHQLVNWKRWLIANYPDASVVMSTCALLTRTANVPRKADIVIQYLHSFPFVNPVGVRQMYLDNVKIQSPRFIFITAYKAYNDLMVAAGYESYYRPMAIDYNRLPVNPNPVAPGPKRIIWLGRIDERKKELYAKLRKACDAQGWILDTISRSRFNGGRVVTQSQAWSIASGYEYGVGVGRSALELYGLGLKVLIAGRSVGGLIMNTEDADVQLATNLNGRSVTYSNDLVECLKALPRSMTGMRSDIRLMDHTAGICH